MLDTLCADYQSATYACMFVALVLLQEGGKDRFRTITGLPIASYFSGTKVMYQFFFLMQYY
jgi:glycerol kinase